MVDSKAGTQDMISGNAIDFYGFEKATDIDGWQFRCDAGDGRLFVGCANQYGTGNPV